MLFAISHIIIDPKLQSRLHVKEETIAEYQAVWESGGVFPPITLVSDKSQVWLVDGHYRLESAKRAGRTEIEAEIIEGDYRKAILLACAANAKHGIRRTNAEKRRQVETLLKDKEWSQWSDRHIADQCMVGPMLVAALRQKVQKKIPPTRTFIHRTGKVATINTERVLLATKIRQEHLPDVPRPPKPAPISAQDLLTMSFASMKAFILAAKADWEHLHVTIRDYPHADGFKGYLAVKNLFDMEVPYLIKALTDARPMAECAYCHGAGECLPCGKSRLMTEAQAKQVRRL